MQLGRALSEQFDGSPELMGQRLELGRPGYRRQFEHRGDFNAGRSFAAAPRAGPAHSRNIGPACPGSNSRRWPRAARRLPEFRALPGCRRGRCIPRRRHGRDMARTSVPFAQKAADFQIGVDARSDATKQLEQQAISKSHEGIAVLRATPVTLGGCGAPSHSRRKLGLDQAISSPTVPRIRRRRDMASSRAWLKAGWYVASNSTPGPSRSANVSRLMTSCGESPSNFAACSPIAMANGNR